MERSARARLMLPRLLAASALGFVAACPDEGNDDDEPTCEMEADQAGCEAQADCIWDAPHEICVVDCAAITDREACLDEDVCYWNAGTCYYGAI